MSATDGTIASMSRPTGVESTTNSTSPTEHNSRRTSAHASAAHRAGFASRMSSRTTLDVRTTIDRSGERSPVTQTPNDSRSTIETRSRTALHEFQSLLEAAQRIADNAESVSARDSLPTSQVDPIIRRTTTAPRPAQAHETQRRIPLTRQYSGRPHVPGEDSGSEDDNEGSEEENLERGDLFSQLGFSRPGRADLDSLLDEEPNSGFVSESLRTMDGARVQTEAYRARDPQSSIAEQMERDRESLRQAVAMTRELRRHQQSRRLNDELSTSSLVQSLVTRSDAQVRSEDHDTGAARFQTLTQSHNPPTAPANSTTHVRPRSRSSSVRRWRPAERLQDYASSHIRRSSRDDHTQNAQSAVQATTAGIPLTWRYQREASGNITRTSSTRLQERGFTAMNSNASEENAQRSSHTERYPYPWDWPSDSAAHASRTEQTDHDEIVSRVERALQEYRLSRRNLRASQEDSSGYPSTSRATLAELSAARASRRQTSTSFSSELPTPFTWEDRWRRDDNVRRRAAEHNREHRRRYLHRLQTALDDAEENGSSARDLLASLSQNAHETSADQLSRLMDSSEQSEKKVDNESLKMAKASLKYLATLREPGMDSAKTWTTAAHLGLHNTSLHEKPNESLPAAIDDLPEPCLCSWLEPGMTWSGTQSADDDDDIQCQTARPSEHEYHTRNRPIHERVNGTSDDIAHFPRRSAELYGSLRNTNADHPPMSSMYGGMPNEAEQRQGLSTREIDEQLTHVARLRRLRARRELLQPKTEPARAKDHWEVKATLHSVDWADMTVTGTMTASQIRGPSGQEHTVSGSSQTDGASMDSFFTGEIIDFLRYGLDTPSSAERESTGQTPSYRDKRQQNDWKVGGPEADLIHWASIGPFKEEVDHIIEKRQRSYDDVLQKLNADLRDDDLRSPLISDNEHSSLHHETIDHDTAPVDHDADIPQPAILTEAEVNNLKLETMHKVLTDKRWLKKHINNEGWVLMRWKERCFVSPGLGPNPEPTRPWIPTRVPLSRFDQSFMTGRGGFSSSVDLFSRQNMQRIYSTNDAEREELGSSSTGAGRSTQATWGLTISGFYYVAMHRLTGRIEALYYDCTSAPYQRLRMSPAVPESTLRSANEAANEASERTASDVPGGLRSSFTIVEFR